MGVQTARAKRTCTSTEIKVLARNGSEIPSILGHNSLFSLRIGHEPTARDDQERLDSTERTLANLQLESNSS